jgi:hypothetical protein
LLPCEIQRKRRAQRVGKKLLAALTRLRRG